jgi:epoxyqueuosine reductase QueG
MNIEKLTTLRHQLENQSIGMGARFFGVADVTVAREFIVEQGGEFLAAYPRALSVGIALNDGIVDQLPCHKEIAVARTYDYLYDTVNQSLNRIALHLSATLSRNSFKALQVPATDRVDNVNIRGLFSQKLAANLAGLGWIGPSCLLITPELGPRVRSGSLC